MQVCRCSRTCSGYSYDAAGNLLFDGLNYYAYDGANRVLSVNSQSTGYVYDAEGNRVAKLGAGGTLETVYVLTAGNAQLDELNGSGGWNHTNVYAPGGRLLATYDSSTQPSPGYHYNLTDWLGTKRMQTTAGGNQQETCTSNPYGDGLSCTGGADATEQHFTGKDHDTESNLDYFYARYYSETLGRFMTPDWAAAPAAVPYASYGDPQSLNLYAYVDNNPLTGVDATGHDMVPNYGSGECPGCGWQDEWENNTENEQGNSWVDSSNETNPDGSLVNPPPTPPGDSGNNPQQQSDSAQQQSGGRVGGLTHDELNRLVALVFAEAGTTGTAGQEAVASSVLNRVNSGDSYYVSPGQSLNVTNVIQAPNQYQGYSTAANSNYQQALAGNLTNSTGYQSSAAAVSTVLQYGVTTNATYIYYGNSPPSSGWMGHAVSNGTLVPATPAQVGNWYLYVPQ